MQIRTSGLCLVLAEAGHAIEAETPLAGHVARGLNLHHNRFHLVEQEEV